MKTVKLIRGAIYSRKAHKIGAVLEVSDGKAFDMIRNGKAVLVEKPAKTAPVVEETEEEKQARLEAEAEVKAEKKRLADEKKAEKKRLADEKKAEKKRLAAEKKANKAKNK